MDPVFSREALGKVSLLQRQRHITAQVFTQRDIPVNHDQIPRYEMLKDWPHLSSVIDKIPLYQAELDIGILIGSNCPTALQPLEVVPTSGYGPFAVRYLHGWTVNGPVHVKVSSNGVSCHRLLVSNVQHVTDCITVESVRKFFELDFFRKTNLGSVPEERGLSFEDRRFVKRCQDTIEFKDGHFQLPMPFRDPNVSLPNNKKQAVSRAEWQRRKMKSSEDYRQQYTAFMDKLFDKGYAYKVPEAISSPSIANTALKATGDKADEKYDSTVGNTIRHNFYVDDCLKSCADVPTAVKLVKDLISATGEGGFRLTKFVSNSIDILKALPTEDCLIESDKFDLDMENLMTRALGMLWDLKEDSFKFSIALKENPLTRRGLLSTISSLYDPLGLLSPIILPAKKLLQELCQVESLDWDERIPDDLAERWQHWIQGLHLLGSFQYQGALNQVVLIQQQYFTIFIATQKGSLCFVANRVRVIRDYSQPEQWRYVSSNDNPADVASRGISVHQLLQYDEWFHGPSFIASDCLFSQEYVYADCDDGESEHVSAVTTSEECHGFTRLIEYYSSWSRLQKAVSIFQQLKSILRGKRKGYATTDAERAIIMYVQQKAFGDEVKALSKELSVSKSSPIYKLDPFLILKMAY
ncbi:uncharacterized protein [Macrobrachium rosenbergii]|uniref:uncharacterized protein n=1 Tax=Macrobrachium rosenbergii TaxID=79674 RepID=UPI0034D62291